jgi:hypothetical protein
MRLKRITNPHKTKNKTNHFTLTKINWLFKDINPVYTGNPYTQSAVTDF